MSEYRHDATHRRSVIFAPNREERPNLLEQPTSGRCPFCAGNEHDTPVALAHYRAGSQPATADDWDVRVVPNKYPAVLPLGLSNEQVDAEPAFGIHEVVIEATRHCRSFSELSVDEATLTFMAYRDRMLAAKSHEDIAYAQIFKNVGAAAGASIEHLHSQLLALTIVPDTLVVETAAAARHLGECGRLWHEDVIADAESRQSVVLETEMMIAFCPRVPRFAFETWIMPKRHAPSFELADDRLLRDAAKMTREIIGRTEKLHPSTAYNFFLHSTPFDTSRYHPYHWHIEFFPRLAKAAGFEWATGWFLNTMPPEIAATMLRESRADLDA